MPSYHVFAESTELEYSFQWLFEFSSRPELQLEFQNFKLRSSTPRQLLATAVVVTAFFAAYWALVFHHSTGLLKFVVFPVSIAISILPLWTLAYFHIRRGKKIPAEENRGLFIDLDNVFIFGFVISCALTTAMRIANGQCESVTLSVSSTRLTDRNRTQLIAPSRSSG